MKTLLRRIAHQLGYDVLPASNDEILRKLLSAYNELRLKPDDLLRWDHLLAHLASLGHLRSLVRSQRIDLLIDIGANRGQFALDARRAGYSGDILSFEPLAAHHPRLEALAAQDGRWKIIHCGLGAQAGKFDLNVYRDDTFSSILKVNASAGRSFGSLVHLDHIESVQLRPLDEVYAELKLGHHRRIFIKTDTQGYDAAVLAGAHATLRQTYVVLTEASVAPLYHGSSVLEQLNALLTPLGFVRAGMFPVGYTPEAHTLIELDCFFVRQHDRPSAESPTAGD